VLRKGYSGEPNFPASSVKKLYLFALRRLNIENSRMTDDGNDDYDEWVDV